MVFNEYLKKELNEKVLRAQVPVNAGAGICGKETAAPMGGIDFELSGTYEGGNLNITMVNEQGGHVEEALGSISLHVRVTTENLKIIGCTQQEMGEAVRKLLHGEVDAADCVVLMGE